MTHKTPVSPHRVKIYFLSNLGLLFHALVSARLVISITNESSGRKKAFRRLECVAFFTRDYASFQHLLFGNGTFDVSHPKNMEASLPNHRRDFKEKGAGRIVNFDDYASLKLIELIHIQSLGIAFSFSTSPVHTF